MFICFTVIQCKTVLVLVFIFIVGDLNLERSLRKQQQISNILAAVKPLVKPGYRIVDFCAGGGHVGIVLAFFLKQCEVIPCL